jgi:hypothetical protein
MRRKKNAKAPVQELEGELPASWLAANLKKPVTRSEMLPVLETLQFLLKQETRRQHQQKNSFDHDAEQRELLDEALSSMLRDFDPGPGAEYRPGDEPPPDPLVPAFTPEQLALAVIKGLRDSTDPLVAYAQGWNDAKAKSEEKR